MTIVTALLIIALILFVLAGLGVPAGQFSLQAFGLAFCVLAWLFSTGRITG